MTKYKSEFLRILDERGYVHQITDAAALDALAAKGKLTAYIGFDATADSLHVGNLVSIMLLRRLQQCGHIPIVLMGGGTSKIGDPSGKDEARQLLSDAEIKANVASIQKIFSAFIQFSPTGAQIINNAEWLDHLNYIPFLRDVGRHFTINRMLTLDSVRLRLEREQPLTFLEFNYMIMQAYDFLELYRRNQCTLQLGGSDQWGNITCGVDLGRRVANADLFGLTTPLITTSSGAKMGKTAAGAVWLKADRLSPYDYWQYWRNTADADVARFLKLFTDVPLDEIARLEKLKGQELNEAKKILAFEATKLCHGANAAREAAETARKTFEERGVGDSLRTIGIGHTELENMQVADLLVRAGLAESKGKAKRLIADKGVKINGDTVMDGETVSQKTALKNEFKLSSGKKNHVIIRVN
jgi:tyrosyl-tRNA synthetase